MATKYAAGTPVTGADGNPEPAYGDYTAEQLVALEDLKDRKYERGIAAAKYVNHVLQPNGELTTDLKPLKALAANRRKAILETGNLEDPAVLRAAAAAADLVREIEDHIAQERFLFVVNEDASKIIYFQCATEKAKIDGKTLKNPDCPKPATKASKAEQEEVEQTMRTLAEDSHRRHAARLQRAQEG